MINFTIFFYVTCTEASVKPHTEPAKFLTEPQNSSMLPCLAWLEMPVIASPRSCNHRSSKCYYTVSSFVSDSSATIFTQIAGCLDNKNLCNKQSAYQITELHSSSCALSSGETGCNSPPALPSCFYSA